MMDWTHDITVVLLAVACTVGWVGLVALVKLNADLQQRVKNLAATIEAMVDTPGAASPHQATGGGWQWQALPGQRIELADTGWAIVLGLRPSEPLYKLLTPEGWPITAAAELGMLKAAAERLARERAEFEPRLHPEARADRLRTLGDGKRGSP